MCRLTQLVELRIIDSGIENLPADISALTELTVTPHVTWGVPVATPYLDKCVFLFQLRMYLTNRIVTCSPTSELGLVPATL
jgi:hypothetical protein